jgi:POT family proton-dependent oligopeptide transporter
MSTVTTAHLTDSDLQKGHPPSLFILFFTEMWERFSYYGMRALLVLFLISSLADGGWAWEREDALQLYGLYTGLVYLTPIFGGLLADKVLGYRKAVIIGALIMTIGHASMALESSVFFYVGLGCLIIGNGLFKPNISSIVGQLYTRNPEKKDAAYTIFYMGINAGAFLGILLCGYIGEKVDWSYGFGLAGVFMLFGLLQFAFAQKIFGTIGLAPKKANDQKYDLDIDKDAGNYAENRAFQKPMDDDITLKRETARINRDRIVVISVFAFFTIFFWWAFEQAGGSMTVFAESYTDRTLIGSSATTFKIVNTLLTVVPMIILTIVLGNLFRRTFKQYALSNLFLGTSFAIIWGIVIWMLWREFKADATEVPASWFGILNSFFIIAFAPLFSKMWESRFNPSGPVKFGIGLILLGLGFAILAYGSMEIPKGAKVASVSMAWLILAYLFHTLGELCVSPVGLSYVSKLAPVKLVGLMFGIWFVANFIANWTAGITGSYIDAITEKYNMATFFLIFTIIPIVAGFIMWGLNPMLKRKMHGVD